MSQPDLEQFCEHVLQDPLLRDKFHHLSDKRMFLPAVVQSGQELGFSFTEEEVLETMQNNRRKWIERFVSWTVDAGR